LSVIIQVLTVAPLWKPQVSLNMCMFCITLCKPPVIGELLSFGGK
jgi:hypothetical protein